MIQVYQFPDVTKLILVYRAWGNFFEGYMGNVIELDENRPHRTAEVICVQCRKRYWCVWPVGTPLKDLECVNCGPGFVIMTGQPIEDVSASY